MLKKQYQTERLLLELSEPLLAGRVAAFAAHNREHLASTEPLREKIYFTEAFQRRALARDLRNAREVLALRLWLLPRQNPAGGDILGVCGLSALVFAHARSALVSFKLGAGHTGQGYMAEALGELIRIAFEDLELHRLECNILPGNAPALRLAKKLGFEEEGLARKLLKVNGAWEDHLRLSRLNEEKTCPR
jgi:ribosomal-protein-alanine N-acetyltransferase